MGPLVDLPAPPSRGTYLVLVEPEVVKIGTSGSIRQRVLTLRTATFRRIALLAWSTAPEKQVHSRFSEDRITSVREFFRLSPQLLTFINECRESQGFQRIEEVQLWEYGGPLPPSGLVEEPIGLVGAKLQSAPAFAQTAIPRILRTERFRSEERRALKLRLKDWLQSDALLHEFLTPTEMVLLRGRAPRESDSPLLSPEEASRAGRYHTHLRWHRNPKPTCEFCTQPADPGA